MKKFIKKYKLPLLGAILGTTAGYLYYKFVGCAAGTCPITSSALYSSMYGASLGALLFSTFIKNKSKTV